MNAEHEKLIDDVRSFLTERKKSDGGYAPVTDVEHARLRTIIYDLIALKYENDSDGDFPINFQTIDLTKYQDFYTPRLPYPHRKETTEEEMMTAICNLSNMLGFIKSKLDSYLSEIEYRKMSGNQ